MSNICKEPSYLCSKNDKIYAFKVRDYSTELVGRKCEGGKFFYIQRGDGLIHTYAEYRVIEYTELKKI